MARLILVLVALLVGAVFVEPTVYSAERAVLLRLRTPDEVQSALRSGSRSLGARLVDAARPEPRLPGVAAEPRREPEGLTPKDRDRLDRLVDRVIQDR